MGNQPTGQHAQYPGEEFHDVRINLGTMDGVKVKFSRCSCGWQGFPTRSLVVAERLADEHILATRESGSVR